MGHTFLFRGAPKGRADSLDWWLSILGCDAMLLSELAGGSRSLMKLSQSFETLAAERRRKGRDTCRESAESLIERLSACGSAMMRESSGKTRLYPSLARHLEKKARYALRLARMSEAPLVGGASAMKEVSFALSLVCEVAQLCPQYLDPSEKLMMRRAREMGDLLEDKLARALCSEGAAAGGYADFLAEADEAATAYRRFLGELFSRAEAGNLLAVFPPSFLVWADGTCALVHRLLKRLASGKSVTEIADEEEDCSECAVRTAPLMPMMILAEHSEDEAQADDDAVREETAVDTETYLCAAQTEAEEQTVQEVVQTDETPLQAEASAAIEKIYAKASDYKHIIDKAVKKGREHGARTPRPLGKRR